MPARRSLPWSACRRRAEAPLRSRRRRPGRQGRQAGRVLDRRRRPQVVLGGRPHRGRHRDRLVPVGSQPEGSPLRLAGQSGGDAVQRRRPSRRAFPHRRLARRDGRSTTEVSRNPALLLPLALSLGACGDAGNYPTPASGATSGPIPTPSPTATVPPGVPSSFAWSSSDVLLSPIGDATHDLVSIKDPSVVYYDGNWHVYASSVTSAGSYGMVYVSFPDWEHTASATVYYLDPNPSLAGYHAAPQLFYFRRRTSGISCISRARHSTRPTTTRAIPRPGPPPRASSPGSPR